MCADKVDRNNRNTFYLWTANRWLNFRCEAMSALFSAGVAFFIVSANVSPGWAGLTLTYAFEFTLALGWNIRLHANMDMAMNAVEPPAWPNTGAIQVKELTVKYGPTQPAVLKNLIFNILPSEKVGIVGRTGAGKSTLILAFFRILEDVEGSIVINDMDVFKMGLRDLRSRLTIIPQDPVLFEGSLRFNLDPVSAHIDERMWEAIKAVGLLESMQKIVETSLIASTSSDLAIEDDAEKKAKASAEGVTETKDDKRDEGTTGLTLDSAVTESGQRQLICMARALLRDSKVFFLDEATASVNEAADANIQRTLRSAFKEGTVITIAHRLKTVIDYDRVMVLDRGEIVEFDEPVKLITKEDGVFKKMCEESGDYADLLTAAENKKITTLAGLNVIVRKSLNITHLGHGFLLVYTIAFACRAIQIRSIAPNAPVDDIAYYSFPRPLTTVSYPLLSGILLVPILTLEAVQRYWQATVISPVRNTNSRRRAARKAEKERNVNAEEGVACRDNEDDQDDEEEDNPEDESSPNYIREPCRYEKASFISKLTFSWIDALLLKAYKEPLENEDIWDLDEDDKTTSTLRKWEPFKHSTKSLLHTLLAFFKIRVVTSYTISLLSCALNLGRPNFLYQLVNYLQTRTGNDPKETLRRYLLLLGLLGTLLFKAIADAMRRAAGVVETKSDNGMFDKPEQKANM
ncbi:hypothetical protein HDU76_005844, partial [Blyttiomyces sp. JEL0837]